MTSYALRDVLFVRCCFTKLLFVLQVIVVARDDVLFTPEDFT